MLGFTHDEVLDFSGELYQIINTTADILNELFNLKLDLQGPYEEVKELSVDGIPEPGIAHFDDIGLLFNVESLNAPTDPRHPFNQFRQKLVILWANFAKYGNPTPANANPLNDVIWKPSGEAGQLLDMGDNFQMIDRKQAINERALITEKYLYVSMPITSDCNEISYANYFSLF